MRRNRLLLTALLGLVGACSEAPPTPRQVVAIPVEQTSQPAQLELGGRVTDAADLLTDAQESALVAKLSQLEADKGHQMVVVTVPSLGGRDIAAFTMELGNRWGIGRADHDDGVILLVAPNEKQARIEVGLGLEGRITDAVAQGIMQEKLIPHFRRGDYTAGIEAGTDALIARLTAEQPPHSSLRPKANDPERTERMKDSANAG